MLRPVVGRWLGGTVAGADGRGTVGEPVWGPEALLRDLELRTGIAAARPPQEALRVAAWSSRLAALLSEEPFYASSYRIDPLGTAEMLLSWRDALIEGGWDGTRVPGGGPRLDVFTQLEAMDGEPMAPGAGDRLAMVEAALALHGVAPYVELVVADDLRVWPGRWRRVFGRLRDEGTRLRRMPTPLGGAPADTDLRELQRRLAAGDDRSSQAWSPRGDGSLALLRAPTAIEAAEAVAAMVGARPPGEVGIIRSGRPDVLDEAFRAHGLPTAGVRMVSTWRPALQVLPLALDMLFEPVDVRSALELLGLPGGPLGSRTRYSMSHALADAPGIGDVRWTNAKQRLRDALGERGPQELATLEAWVEPRRHGWRDGAPREAIVATVRRVLDWLRPRGAAPSSSQLAAVEQCVQVAELIDRDPRGRFDRLAVRQLVAAASGLGASATWSVEEAGRVAHVDHPSALLHPRPLVVWWFFAASTATPPHRSRWRAAELRALEAAGVSLVASDALLAEESGHWRTAALQARAQLLLVLPDRDRGQPTSAHPFWDEIVARLRLDDVHEAALTIAALDLATRPPWQLELEPLPMLPLPEARPSWHVPPGRVPTSARLTAPGIEDLLDCPLRWVLGTGASLRSRSVPAIAEGALLNGILGHRLVQRLVELEPVDTWVGSVERILDELLPVMAAPLLQPGMRFELLQLRHQLTRAVDGLVGLLQRSGMRVAGVEEEITAPWLATEVVGRLDLRLVDQHDREAIVDLKWGLGRYRAQLEQGRAVQLAVYAQVRRVAGGQEALPSAAYLSLSRGRLSTTDPARFGEAEGVGGPPLGETVARITTTVPAVRVALEAGFVPVTGVSRARPLLDSLEVAEDRRDAHYPSTPRCDDCGFGAVCGRAWERLE